MRLIRLIFALALAFAPAAALAQNNPSPPNLITSQVSCTSTAGLLVAAQGGRFHVVTIENLGSNPFFIGGSGVTASGAGVGFEIPGVQYTSMTLAISGPVYCITASSTSTVSVAETY